MSSIAPRRRLRSPIITCISWRSTKASTSRSARVGERRASERALGLHQLVGSHSMAMKMRQSLAQLEQEFRHETQLDRSRRETLRRHAVRRSRKRTHERRRKAGSMRYWVLIFTLIATAVIVTAVMFETLYLLLS